jgi:four helix bundle protein
MAYVDGLSFGFEELEVYQEARKFRGRIYKLARLLPSEEKFVLKQQMQDAAISVTNNIAEGHGRYNWQDNTKFCRNSRGSLCELVDDINACIDENYAKKEHLMDLKAHGMKVLKLLNGYIAYLQKRKVGDNATD